MNKKIKKKKRLLYMMAITFMISILSISLFKATELNNLSLSPKDAQSSSIKLDKNLLVSNKDSNSNNIEIIIGGNIKIDKSIHKRLLKYNQSMDEFLSYMKKSMKKTISIFNLSESLLKNTTSSEFTNALNNIGVDIINTNVENVFNKGNKALFESLDVLKNSKLNVLGLKDNLTDKEYKIINIDGVNVGFVDYNLTEDVSNTNLYNHISSLNVNDIAACSKKIDKDIECLKEKKAEIIFTMINDNSIPKHKANEIISILNKKENNYIINYNNNNFIEVNKEKNTMRLNNNSNFLSMNNIYNANKYEVNYLIKLKLEKSKNEYKVSDLEYIPLTIYEKNKKMYLIPLIDKKQYKNLNVKDLRDVKILESRREETLRYIQNIIRN
ncbi:CapA family protein [Hathewaya histolytica]|uniref:Bacterial capsule synthesis protein PGA_cap n=1 Tax=Hathewaya histolytica TaxID=1498 RepID=A0A4U9RKP3_HATHI|nr:CapA family protein [Hathewaya histolytica]VTQ89420.1 Bacterial capsule synthesis protein PGA_cap [Hathewaya histolytica]